MQIDPRQSRDMRFAPGDFVHNSSRTWLHLLSALIELAQGKAQLLEHSERPWASATFSGSRHVVVLEFVGLEAVAAGDIFIARLDEHEFTVPRVLVADACVAAADQEVAPLPRLTVTAELLLLDEE